jgi:hypothetical protein
MIRGSTVVTFVFAGIVSAIGCSKKNVTGLGVPIPPGLFTGAFAVS